MRVLMVTWEYPPHVVGGMGKHVAELVPALAELAGSTQDFYLDVLTTRPAGGPRVEKLNDFTTIYRVETSPMDPQDIFNSVVSENQPLERMARKLAKQHPYQLIHIHDWLVGTVGVVLKHAWKVPLVVTMHATERGRHQGHLPGEVNRQINQLEWKICYEAWRIIVCSGFMAGELGAYFSVPLDKISVIPNGVDPDPFERCTNAEIERLRRRYAPNGERLLFFVGRITPEKGLPVLLRAMPLILEFAPNTRLLVAGKNSEQMQPEVDRLGISSAVKLLGFISDEKRNALYRTVDAAIFPSIYEPFGIVALEAMAADCNVIVSDVGGLSEVVSHTHSGLTVLVNNPRSIAWAVERLFANPARAAQWRSEAVHQVRTFYGWPLIAEHTVDLYKAVVDERRHVDW